MLETHSKDGRAQRLRRAAVATLCATALVASLAFPASAETRYKSSMDSAEISPAVDALIMRPLGLLTLLTGVGLCVPATLITAITRPTEIGKPFHELVVKPARYVWVDPLGEH